MIRLDVPDQGCYRELRNLLLGFSTQTPLCSLWSYLGGLIWVSHLSLSGWPTSLEFVLDSCSVSLLLSEPFDHVSDLFLLQMIPAVSMPIKSNQIKYNTHAHVKHYKNTNICACIIVHLQWHGCHCSCKTRAFYHFSNLGASPSRGPKSQLIPIIVYVL